MNHSDDEAIWKYGMARIRSKEPELKLELELKMKTEYIRRVKF